MTWMIRKLYLWDSYDYQGTMSAVAEIGVGDGGAAAALASSSAATLGAAAGSGFALRLEAGLEVESVPTSGFITPQFVSPPISILRRIFLVY